MGKPLYNDLIETRPTKDQAATHIKEFIMTVRYSLLNRTATATFFVISLLLTAATLNSVVIAAATTVATQG